MSLDDDIDALTHSHVYLGTRHDENARRTLWVVLLTAAMMVGEIAAGIAFNSMALLADGFHMATHAGALGVAALAYRYARHHATSGRYSFGTGKVGDLAGFASALVLGIVAIGIAWESAIRLVDPSPVAFGEAAVIAVIGLGVWLLRAQTRIAALGLGLIIGGALGNGIDRQSDGFLVVDFPQRVGSQRQRPRGIGNTDGNSGFFRYRQLAVGLTGHEDRQIVILIDAHIDQDCERRLRKLFFHPGADEIGGSPHFVENRQASDPDIEHAALHRRRKFVLNHHNLPFHWREDYFCLGDA